ncbi:hypothetical protein K0M31_019831 [Melipona bicolor]|uniref:Uncharacterized protein n=1 Tax=Melipona bicolor TaxID=60889 RepID=A0AA40G363_9HYME|nr:hypothetical protein K0M31_019831 [Melipona bicolor]
MRIDLAKYSDCMSRFEREKGSSELLRKKESATHWLASTGASQSTGTSTSCLEEIAFCGLPPSLPHLVLQ